MRANDRTDFHHHFVAGVSGWTLLALHGTGADENDLLPVARMLAPGDAVLSPRGKVLENGMNRWFRRLAEGVFDLDDLKARTDELAAFVEASAKFYDLDIQRLLALGFSNGANIGWNLMFLHPGLLFGAILLRPMAGFEPDEPPDLSGTDVFIASGKTDPLVPPDNARRLTAQLLRYGAGVTHHWSPAGHGLVENDLKAVRYWIAKTRKGSM